MVIRHSRILQVVIEPFFLLVRLVFNLDVLVVLTLGEPYDLVQRDS